MHSLGVGNVRSYQEVKAHCDETGAKIVKSRFVFTDKVDVDQQHIVRARLVAKDFAFNQPSALDLGIASQTASVEAFKAFICRVVQDMLVLWGLDVSTAFLYAKLVLDTVLELPGCFQNLDGSKAYVILEKAIYGLRSAGLSWQKHLAGLLAELGLFPSLIEPTLYKGYWGDILVLCLVYVDDILLATRSKETNQQLLDFLTGRLKVKLTGRLEEDGRIGFLGREIIKRGRDILLAVKKEYVESIFEAFGWNREARRKMKACTVPPDLRSVLDKEDPAKPSEELSPEAASRYRSTLGKLGWLVQTRGDLCYFHSLLSRGQCDVVACYSSLSVLKRRAVASQRFQLLFLLFCMTFVFFAILVKRCDNILCREYRLQGGWEGLTTAKSCRKWGVESFALSWKPLWALCARGFGVLTRESLGSHPWFHEMSSRKRAFPSEPLDQDALAGHLEHCLRQSSSSHFRQVWELQEQPLGLAQFRLPAPSGPLPVLPKQSLVSSSELSRIVKCRPLSGNGLRL